MGKVLDITNEKYGKLTAIKIDHIGESGKRYWLCECDCGNTIIAKVDSLRSGNTKSCGCTRREKTIKRNLKHNGTGTRLYRIWQGLFKRCRNKNSTDYYNYGARGIKVCNEWEDFINFRNWAIINGYTDELTIERIDFNGNYEPSNCTWITKSEQVKNKRKRTKFPPRDSKGRFIKTIFDKEVNDNVR